MSSEAAIDVMADALVSAGHLTREQVAQGRAAEQASASEGTRDTLGMVIKLPDDGMAPSGRAHVQARAAELVRSGEMTQSEADAALANYDAAALPEETQTPAEKTPAGPLPLAASGAPNPWEGVELPDGFGPPANPTDYRFDLYHSDPLTLDQLRGVGETFHAARLPVPIASQIYSEIVSCASQNLDEAGLELLKARTLSQLEAVWGKETDARIKVAVDFVRQLDKVRPGVIRLLNESGAGSSPVVIRQLYEHAQRLARAPRKS